jgi:hypothetical protein
LAPDSGGGIAAPRQTHQSLPLVLFVAREPDETLRTFLPILRGLAQRARCVPFVLYHHTPGEWARSELVELGVEWRELTLPARARPSGFVGAALSRARLAAPLSEIRQLVQVRRTASRVMRELGPAAVVVIQDTLLLERFLVREANRLRLPSLVVQWAFTYPQEYYDRFHERPSPHGRKSRLRALASRLTGRAYRAALDLSGVGFQLANTYGGGEAPYLAVMGNAFEQQFREQGAQKTAIYVAGHPSHDAVFERVKCWQEQDRLAVLTDLGFAPSARLVAYATQPTLWRGVLTPSGLREMVETVVEAALALGPEHVLVVKLHPRERLEDYAFLEGRARVAVVKDADVQRLIAASDVFVSSSSSTLLYAMMFGKPIVTINFHGVQHFDYFANLGGTLHVSRAEEFASALAAALRDDETRTRLWQEQQALLARFSRFDGLATERLVSLIEDWVISGAPK